MIYDPDGAQKQEVIFLLEKVRRSLSLLKVYQAKTDGGKIEQGVQKVATFIRSLMAKLQSQPAG